jgi:hypothetical protein
MTVCKHRSKVSGSEKWTPVVVAYTLLIASGLAGCKRSRLDELPLRFPVQGKIFVGDKPAEGAVIAFHPVKKAEGPSSTSRGTADSQGKFSLTTYVSGDGAPEGEYIVTVYWPERPLNPNGEGHDLPVDKLRGKFANPAASKLRARIGPQLTTLPRLDLGSQAVQQAKAFYLETGSP